MTGAYWWTATEPLPPIDLAKLKTYPRLGCSIASLVVNRQYPIREVAKAYADCGVTFTTVNLLSAEWPTLVPYHARPFLPANGHGQYDLYAWNPEHVERIQECAEEMNARNIVVQWCFYELYSWSIRKAGPGTPDARQGPWQQNVNDVDWVGPYYPAKHLTLAKQWDSDMLAEVFPDAWSKAYLGRIVPSLGLDRNVFLIGNEMPEKSLHERVRDFVRLLQPGAKVSVNRNEETPGQYANMKIGINYDLINFHGRRLKAPADLDRVYPPDESSVPTFRTLFKLASTDPRRIIVSSDGARISDDPIDTYAYGTLRDLVRFLKPYGVSFEHQSRCKMSPFPNLHLLERDWLTSLAKEYAA